ncbi:MAG: DNA polymerase [Phycisphaerales bacterium]|nr:DNA polymerase [Phycisphaerales bacterium]
MSLTTLWVDMDAYFASAEQHLQPRLRGRPVGVVPVFTADGRPAESSCCIAVSYAARPSGVRTGTLVREARRLCPDICLVHARPTEYVRLHHAILNTVETVIPVDMKYSIDEFACRLLGNERDPARAAALGLSIKHSLKERFSAALTCSIGIAPNRLLSKVAADQHKPDGLHIVEASMLPQCLYDLNLEDWPGISRGMRTRFEGHRVTTTEQMYALTEQEMAQVFGSVDGKRWWLLIRGFDLPDKATVRRTLGHQHVLPPEKRHRDAVYRVLVRLLTKAAQRLRREGYCTCELVCAARLLPAGQWSRRTTLPPTRSTRVLLAAMVEQWTHAPDARYLVIAATLQRLIPVRAAPAPLFPTEQAEERLDQAVDRINARFGYGAIRPASADIAAAPLRIAFSSIPDLDMPDLHG